MNFFIVVPPKTAFLFPEREKVLLSYEKREISLFTDTKTITPFNIFVKAFPKFREIAEFCALNFVYHAQLTGNGFGACVENGKSENEIEEGKNWRNM